VSKEVTKKIEESAKEFGVKAKKALGVVEKISPRTVRGVMLVAATVPSIYLVAAATAAVAPHVQQYIVYLAPIIVHVISMSIALTIVSLALGLVRAFVLS